MPEWLTSTLFELRQNFRLADAVDIVIIAVFLYAAILWFRRAASRRMLLGVVMLGVVYLLARLFDLYLTSLLFEAGLAVVVIMLIVVFQEDLRRAFENIGTYGSSWRRRASSRVSDADVLVEVAFKLASQRVGALMAITGREPLERHTDGGHEIEGRISAPLLLSIFDPHSLGHDGAVIFDKGRIEEFGVHLPISKNLKEIRGRGTRHSAALGLSECSDALTIAVSEERGTVTLAENGKLVEVSTEQALRARIDGFIREKFPEQAIPLWKRSIRQYGGLKLVSVSLAILAWFALAYDVGTVQRSVEAEIDYHDVPDSLAVGQLAPSRVRLTLSGPERAFRGLEADTLRIFVDLDGYTEGRHSFPITERNLKLPPRLTVYRIDPGVVVVDLNPRSGDASAKPDVVPGS